MQRIPSSRCDGDLGAGMTAVTSDDAREAVAAFRDAVTGATEGPTIARGSVMRSLHRAGGWRADWLWVTRAIIRAMLAGFASDLTQRFHGSADATEAAAQVGAYWGVERYPVTRPRTEGKRMIDWAGRVYTSRPALMAAERAVNTYYAEWRDSTPTHRTSVAWVAHEPEEWPPVGPVRTHLIGAVRGRVTLPASLIDSDEQFVQILRRRTAQLHHAYVAGNSAIKTRFWYLRHSIVRPWFHEDLLDLRDDPDDDLGVAKPSSDPRVARSQAAVSMLMFHAAVREWDDGAYKDIVKSRLAAFRSAEDPIIRYIRKGLEKGSAPKEENQPEPSLSGLEHLGGTQRSHRVMRAVVTYRRTSAPGDAADYMEARSALSDDWDLTSQDERRIVLLADQAMHLTVVGNRRLDESARDRISKFLEESAQERLEYRAFVWRDRALQEAKGQRLDRAMAAGQEGRRVLRSSASDPDFRSGERVLIEVEQQMNLLMAGNAVKIVEAMMARSTVTRRTAHHADEVIRARAAAAVGWASLAMDAVHRLEAEGWLASQRYEDGHLGDASWRTQTRIIWHRCLCAAFTMMRAYGLRSIGPYTLRPWMDVAATADPLADVTIETLDAAFIEMTSMSLLTPVQHLNIAQATLWHSFLRGRRVSFDVSQFSDALTEADYLTPSGAPERWVQLSADRALVATGRLLVAQYDCGAIEFVPRGSLVWKALESLSHGSYSQWRDTIAALRVQSGA